MSNSRCTVVVIATMLTCTFGLSCMDFTRADTNIFRNIAVFRCYVFIVFIRVTLTTPALMPLTPYFFAASKVDLSNLAGFSL